MVCRDQKEGNTVTHDLLVGIYSSRVRYFLYPASLKFVCCLSFRVLDDTVLV